MSNNPNDAVATPQANDVGRLARRGAMWAGATVVGRQISAFITSIILAHLLSPAEFGINAMAMTMTWFLTFLSDAGLSMVTIQRRELSKQQVDNLFWVNVAVGVLLWAACTASGPLLADFYKRPELTRVMAVLGLTFIAGGFGVQPLALMRRNLKQRDIAMQEAVSALVFAGLGIGLALAGFSYWALIYQTVGYTCARTVMVFVQSGYRPGPWHRNVGTRGLLKFGGAMCLYAILVYLSRNLDNIMIGRHWGAEALGYYSRAYFLMMAPSLLIATSLADVMVPSLSALKHDPERMGDAYRRTMRLIAFLGCPISLWLALSSSEVIRLVYGPKWAPVSPILLWLSVAGLFQPLYNTIGWLFLVMGATRAMLIWSLGSTCVLAMAFGISLPYGATAVAAAYAVVMTFGLALPGLGMAHRAAGLSLWRTVRPLVPIVVGAVGAAGIAMATGYETERLGLPWLAVLLVKTLVALGVYVVWAMWRLRPLPIERLEALAQVWAPRTDSYKT
ncbi:MAG TPA: lipopolysaccharide biosynthesis protein [Armatimonadota bacterium]|jgi:PST family polysaccharide transporter